MKIWYNNTLEAKRYVAEVVGDTIRVGREPDNDIVLNSPYVAKHCLLFEKSPRGWEMSVLGAAECRFGDRTLRNGERVVVQDETPIKIWNFVLNLEFPAKKRTRKDDVRRERDEQMSQLIREIHVELLVRMDLNVVNDKRSESDKYMLTLERTIEEIAAQKGLSPQKRPRLIDHFSGYCTRAAILGMLIERSGQSGRGLLEKEGHWSEIVTKVPDREEELRSVVNVLQTRLGVDGIPKLTEQIARVENDFWPLWEDYAKQLFDEFKSYIANRQLKKEIKDIVFGYGPLEDLLRIPTITEIMVVDRDHIYVEKSGILENSGRRFTSDEVTKAVIERIVSKVGRRIDKSQPLVDARLTDGSRVNAVIPPLAVSGPCLTIRKFPQRKIGIEDLLSFGTLTNSVKEFLRAAVLNRRNILISGGTGSGKTTLLNCLSDFIPDKERIVTVEDTAELQLKKEHVVRLETRAANVEGAGAYTIRDLVVNSLRMRPDRIVIGECRGAEALDLLQAMNTGHDGSLATIHANSAEDAVLRLEVLVQEGSKLPVSSIHRLIASAIDLVVQLTKLKSGVRRITQVTEYLDVGENGEGVRTKDIFRLDDVEGSGQIRPTGRLPTFIDELIDGGYLDMETFYL